MTKSWSPGPPGTSARRCSGSSPRAGHPVRGLTRRPPPDHPGPVELVAGDLTRPDSLRAPRCRGVDAVFLLAGYPDAPGLLATLRSAGVGRVVLLSSGAVVGGDLDNYVVSRYNVVSEAAVRDSGPGLDGAAAQRVHVELAGLGRPAPPRRHGPGAVRRRTGGRRSTRADVAAVAVLALTGDPGHAGRSHRLTGPRRR